ncbi:MAG: AAA family ATPase [Pelolinea sp.]|nr:AAA family ATPase [Pelolinea sp.]
MAIEELIEFTKEKIKEFGGKEEEPKNYVFRNNTKVNALEEGGAYFGFIHPEEEPTGAYHDLCIVLFPDESDGENPWLLCLGIGSLGFKNDFEIASLPGLRRSFEGIISNNGFCKTDLTDIDQPLPKEFMDRIPHLSSSLKMYSKLLPVCEILDDPLSLKSKERIAAFLAIYAKARGWIKPRPKRLLESYTAAIKAVRTEEDINDEEKLLNLITRRKFVILTGAPGTGKTRLAKIVSTKLNAESFFVQFHADTDYSDFIYGIIPNLEKDTLGYKEKIGTFSKALKYAKENPNQKVLLIVDEINRANLSNILGPIFYLFEYRLNKTEASEEIEIYPGFRIDRIPENFFMIGTMNTADRSLAVVDFALRRRFAWYELKPKPVNNDGFFLEDFQEFQEIFFWYANSQELNLQPGQGYFFADNEDEFKLRIEYELLPLIREYLQEQLLKPAQEEFNNYFYRRIEKNIFS